MKKLFILPILSLLLFACGGAEDANENAAEEKEETVDMEVYYEKLAVDACDCVNESMDMISPEMVQVIVDSDGDQAKLQELMMVYATDNPVQAMEDAQAMQGAMVRDITTCMSALEEKYDDIYTLESERDIQEKLLKELEDSDDCKTAYVFMKMGMAQ